MHRPDIDKLVNSPSYRLIMELDLKDLVAYLQRHVHDHTPIMYWYKRLVLGLMLVWGIGSVSALLFDTTVALGHIPGLLLRTLAILLFIIPLHEAIHILTLVYVGARDIRFRASLRQLYIAVTVHQFVASAREIACSSCSLQSIKWFCWACWRCIRSCVQVTSSTSASTGSIVTENAMVTWTRN